MSKITPSSIRVGQMLEICVDEILSEIKIAVNQIEKDRFTYEYIREQGGNGRGNKGRTIDFYIIARFRSQGYDFDMGLLIETKNYSDYKIKSPFKPKFMDKITDTRNKLKKANLDWTPSILVGHYNLTEKQKKMLRKEGVVYFLDVGKQLREDAKPEEIEEYKIKLRCELLAVLDVIFPNLLNGIASNCKLCVYDKYNIAITKDDKFFHNMDLRNIKQGTWYYIGSKLMDFIAWSESPEGVIGLALSYKEYYFDDDRVVIKTPIVGEKSDRCIEQLEWYAKEAVVNVRKN